MKNRWRLSIVVSGHMWDGQFPRTFLKNVLWNQILDPDCILTYNVISVILMNFKKKTMHGRLKTKDLRSHLAIGESRGFSDSVGKKCCFRRFFDILKSRHKICVWWYFTGILTLCCWSSCDIRDVFYYKYAYVFQCVVIICFKCRGRKVYDTYCIQRYFRIMLFSPISIREKGLHLDMNLLKLVFFATFKLWMNSHCTARV